MPASAPTTRAAKGPNATAAKTNGKKATDPSVLRVSGTLCLSATAARTARPATIQIEGNGSASAIPAESAAIHKTAAQTHTLRLLR